MSSKAIFRLSLFVTGLFIFALSLKTSLAQTDRNNTVEKVENLKKQADSVYGTSHELVNGEIYYQSNLYAKGNPFFLSNDWLEGSVLINGTEYKNVFLKYNIETDQLILRPTLKNGMSTAIVLNSSFVESFLLADNLFINSEPFGSKELKSVFVNQIYNGSFSFLASYKVIFISDYKEKTPYGKYSDMAKSYFIYDKGELIKIASKKALFGYFETYKKDIKKFMKKEKIRYKKANPSQWKGLMKFIDDLINTSSK